MSNYLLKNSKIVTVILIQSSNNHQTLLFKLSQDYLKVLKAFPDISRIPQIYKRKVQYATERNITVTEINVYF